MSLMVPARSSKSARSRKPSKQFRVGTTGWSVDDLDDPEIERQFVSGRFEIVDGVLTEMAPPIYDGGYALAWLSRIVEQYLQKEDPRALLVPEVDLVLGKHRLGVVDALYLGPSQLRRQITLHAASGKRKELKIGRVTIPPALVIESVSRGHEVHDHETKRRWYEEFKIANYWILDGMEKSLLCLRLRGGKYIVDCEGSRNAVLKPSAFPGLVIHLGDVWL